MKTNRLTQVGFISIIANILIIVIGLFYKIRSIMIIGWALFVFSILYLAVLQIIILIVFKKDVKSSKIFKPLKNCPYCGNSIPKDAKKCHICGKNFLGD